MTKFWFWSLLLIAFAVRVLLAFTRETILHPDEIFQNLEQAHYFVYKAGITPWEYFAGLRSYLIPSFIAAILFVLKLLGLTSPEVYVPVVRVVFCLFSMLLPIGMFCFARRFFNLPIAIMSLLFGCFFKDFLFYAHKPLPTLIATNFLMGAFLFYDRLEPKTPSLSDSAPSKQSLLRLSLFTGMIVFTSALRIQLFPVSFFILAVLYYSFFKQKKKQELQILVLSAAIWTFAVGLFDVITWRDIPWYSYLRNFQLNLLEGYASTFGTRPWYWYFKIIFWNYYGLFFLGMLLSIYKKQWYLIALLLLILLPHSLIAHKEGRFMFTTLPLFLLMIAYVSHTNAPEFFQGQSHLGNQRRWSLGLIGLLWTIPPLPPIEFTTPEEKTRHVLKAFQTLYHADDVSGVGVDNYYYNGAGYYYLHKKVPLYSWSLFHQRSNERGNGNELRFNESLSRPRKRTLYESHHLLRLE